MDKEHTKFITPDEVKAKDKKNSMNTLLSKDIREDMDAITFRKLMNAANPENQLQDLTYNLINSAIE